MPRCVVCGSPLTCTHVDKHADPLEKPCTLKDGAIFVHVMDELGAALAQIDVDVDGTKKQTEPSGFARFDPLKHKEEAFKATLPGELPPAYDPPDRATKAVWLSQGEVAYLSFVLPHKPTLEVLVTRTDTGAGVAGVSVLAKPSAPEVGKPPAREKKSEGDTGLADFGLIARWTYTIEADLTAPQKKKFKEPASLVDQSFTPREHKKLSLPLQPVVMLRVILWDRADKGIENAQWTLTSPAKNGTTGTDGLIEVDVSDLAKARIVDAIATELSVTLPGPPPVVPPVPGTPPAATVYPQPIKPADFKDVVPVAAELQWKFEVSLVDIEDDGASATKVKERVEARLANLAFGIDGTEEKTTAAVTAYQRLYKKDPVTGLVADIKADIKARHDDP
jgi:hypothetical protein